MYVLSHGYPTTMDHVCFFFSSEELNVAEMLLSDTERRVHNLREDLSDLHHKVRSTIVSSRASKSTVGPV